MNLRSNSVPTVEFSELDNNPHNIYRRFRERTPLLKRPDGSYIAIRARDVEGLTIDPRTRQMETELIELRGITSGPLYDILAHSMVSSNGEAHRRRRGHVSRTFALRMIAALRPRIGAIANSLIEARFSEGRMNLLDDYATLIPARTIATMLGLPSDDIPYFTRLVYTISQVTTFSLTAEQLVSVMEAARQLTDYVKELLGHRRTHPRDDFLTAVSTDESDLSQTEIISQVITLIVAGSDTTRSSIAIQTALLLEHQEQWQAICEDPTLIPGAVLEALRFEPSSSSLPRLATGNIDIDGYVVPSGSILTLSTMSAMRDKALYIEPDQFNIRRTDHPGLHWIFGGGAHRCLGEALAKAELEESLAVLVMRLPQLEPDGEPLRVEGHSGIRRPSSFHVSWR
jgi:cytochrome P450